MKFRPRKRFGQNFLRDPIIVNQIITSISLRDHQHIVEIGPGHGVLTDYLGQCRRLDIIEIDRDLASRLKDKFGSRKHIFVHQEDALTFDFSNISSPGPVRIVGNLPYNISTPLLFHLLGFSECIEDMHFMLQKEVVDRICAEPGSKRYGKLSVMMQYGCKVEKLFDVAPECFVPPPKVESSIIRIVPFEVPPIPVASTNTFKKVVTHAFGQRRKKLSNALKRLLSEKQIKSLEIDPNLRAENLELEAFAKISNFLHQHNGEDQ